MSALRILFLVLFAIGPHAVMAESAELDAEEDNEIRLRRYQKPLAPAPFRLTDHEGRVFNEASLREKWSVVFFGYTSCADVCPTTLSALNSVAKKVSEGPNTDNFQFVFISVDPRRDSLERLNEHVSFFNSSFIGVTGELKELIRFSASLGAMFDYRERGTKKIIKNLPEYPEGEDYMVGHVSDLFVFNPDGNLSGIIYPPHEPEHIIAALKELGPNVPIATTKLSR